jgi:hypothetical protein
MPVMSPSFAAALEERSIAAWNNYIREARSHMRERSEAGPFLWIDEAPGRRSQVHNGEILVSPMGPIHPKRIPSALVHDWVGAAFVPNATLEGTLAVVRDYSRYKEFYRPVIAESNPLGWNGTAYQFSIVIVNKTLFSQTALHSECDDSYFQVDPKRWYSIGSSDNVREIENYGQPNARELPPGEGAGYVWRIYTVSRFEERDGGVYVEREVIVLSRDIPAALRWLIEPIVNRLSRTSLSTSLLQTREAVVSSREALRHSDRDDARVPQTADITYSARAHALCKMRRTSGS